MVVATLISCTSALFVKLIGDRVPLFEVVVRRPRLAVCKVWLGCAFPGMLGCLRVQQRLASREKECLYCVSSRYGRQSLQVRPIHAKAADLQTLFYKKGHAGMAACVQLCSSRSVQCALTRPHACARSSSGRSSVLRRVARWRARRESSARLGRRGCGRRMRFAASWGPPAWCSTTRPLRCCRSLTLCAAHLYHLRLEGVWDRQLLCAAHPVSLGMRLLELSFAMQRRAPATCLIHNSCSDGEVRHCIPHERDGISTLL